MNGKREDYCEFHESREYLKESFPEHYPSRHRRYSRGEELDVCDDCRGEFEASAIDSGRCPECLERYIERSERKVPSRKLSRQSAACSTTTSR